MKISINFNESEFNAISMLIKSLGGKSVEFSELENETAKTKAYSGSQTINEDKTVTTDIDIKSEFISDLFNLGCDLSGIIIGAYKGLKGLVAIGKISMAKWKVSEEEMTINHFFEDKENASKVIAVFIDKSEGTQIIDINEDLSNLGEIITKAGKKKIFYGRKNGSDVEVTENPSRIFLWMTDLGKVGKREATEETKAE